MSLPRSVLSARVIALFGIVLLGLFAAGSAVAQEDKWLKDLKPLVPPVVPLPPNSQVNPGPVGGTQTPYTTAPLQSPTQSPSPAAPGLKLSIPSR